MAKEVAIKIKVQGEELIVTGKQVDVFKNQIKTLRGELDALGARTEANAALFDQLTGDLQQLEAAFGETKTQANEAADAIQDMGDQTEEAGDKTEETEEKTKSYAAQIKALKVELAGLGERTNENGAQYDSLQERIRNLSEAQEDLNRGVQKLDDALGQLPGPIGMVGRTFKAVEDTFKNTKVAFKGLTDTFPILKNAIAATGIGALVIVLGLIIAAVMKASKSFEPLQAAFGKFGRLIDIVMKGIKPLTDFLLNAFVGAIELTAKAIAFLTGNLEEYNKAAASEDTNRKLEKNLNQQEMWFEANADKYDEFTQRKLKSDIDFNKKKVELNQKFLDGEIKTQEELDKLIGQFYDKRNREIVKADKDRSTKQKEIDKAAGEKAKAANDKTIQDTRDFENKLRDLKNNNALLRIKDENQKQRLSIKQSADNEVIQIQQTIKNADRRLKLITEVREKERLILKNFNDKVKQDEINAQIELDIELEALNDKANNEGLELQRLQLTRQTAAERTALTKKLDDLKIYGEERQKALDNFSKYEAETLAKFDREILLNRILNFKERERIATQYYISDQELTTQLLQNQILLREKADEKLTELYNDRIESEKMSLSDSYKFQFDQTQDFLESQDFLLTEAFINGEIDLKEYNDTRKVLVEQSFQNEAQFVQRQIALDQLLLQSKYAVADKSVEIASNAASLISAIAGESFEMQKAAAIAEAGVAIARIVIDTQRGNVAFAASVAPLGIAGPPLAAAYTIKSNIAAGISIATIIAQGINKLTSISSAQVTAGSKEGASGGMGKNYEDGGMIGGRRHAQGGTMIEAEQGEAIMTRGAVTLFGPLLSAMNTMGGGTSFGSTMVSSYDKPQRDRNVEDQMIIKTYVVENEMTSIQHRQARLKDLSTI